MKPLRNAVTLGLLLASFTLAARGENVHIRVRIRHESGKDNSNANAHVVVWLKPLDASPAVEPLQHVRLTQKDKRFVPHLLVVTTGTKVAFPNLDPFFHNVFSIYKGKRFDLGLYEAGSSRSVEFERPGVSFIFCNIHPEMSGIVMVLDTPYYAQSDAAGDAQIGNVPPGRYRLNVWYERSSAEALKALDRDITIPLQHDLGVLDIPEVVPENAPHKNKYGKDYDADQPYKP